jgi:hypothetical protein
MDKVIKKAEEFLKMFQWIDEDTAKKEKLRANIYIVKKEYQDNEELKNLIYKAHDNMMPDDYKYSYVVDALNLISECSEDDIQEEIYNIEADIYTSDLTNWLNSSNSRVYYLTEALEEYGITDGFQALSIAQQKERQEIANSVFNSLKEIVKE